MSRSYRSYDEDWQRRKSLLIRSLFHDIPILSPVQEESSDYIQPRSTYNVPSCKFDSPERPYSPLPPLIIERAPNKHDEPEEHYSKLLIKIKRIYRKLFIENIDFDCEDYNLTLSDNSINSDYFIQIDSSGDVNLDSNVTDNQRKDNVNVDSINYDARQSNDSFHSDGYSADFESIESDELIDVVNYTKSNEDEEMTYEEEDSTKTTTYQEISETEDPNELITEQESTEESNELTNKKDQRINRNGEELDSLKSNDHEVKKSSESNAIRIDSFDFRKTEEQMDKVRMFFQEMNKSDDSDDDIQIKEVGSLDSEKIKETELNKSEDCSNFKIDAKRTIERKTSNKIEFADYELNESEEFNVGMNREENNNSKESSNTDNNNQNETTCNFKESDQSSSKEENVLNQPDEGIMEDDEIIEGTDYRQITTEALVHVDGSQDVLERESRVYEDSVKSLILPTREFKRLIQPHRVNVEHMIEELSALEDNEDPATTTLKTDDSEYFNDIEVMRTPQPKVSQESIPITRCSKSDNASSEHNALPPKLNTLTSSTQDGCNDISELRTTDDIDQILTSIFNTSPNKDEGSPSRKKRKIYEDISVQTSERVSWEEMRSNFFVGTPKIFRLCACVDHICD